MSDRCAQVREHLSALADGEAPLMAPQQVRRHLLGCTSCRALEQRMGVIDSRSLSLHANLAPDPDLLARLRDELHASLTADAAPPGVRARIRRSRARHRDGTRRVTATLGRWALAVVPAVTAVVVLPVSASSHAHGKPLRTPTPCTAGLHQVASGDGRPLERTPSVERS